jgi:hypothetical protein
VNDATWLSIIDKGKVVAAFLVVIGVGGEFLADYIEGPIIKRRDESLRLDIAHADERAASANETAERERLARLQLEARLAPRVLTSDQQKSIGVALRRLGTFSVQIFTYSDVTEVTNIGNAIGAALAHAGWTVGFAQAQGGISVSGIVLAVSEKAPTAVRDAATHLANELRAEGIGISLSDVPLERIPGPGMYYGNEINDPQMRVMIGTK